MKYDLIKKYGLSRAILAKTFGYKNVKSFNTSSSNKVMMKGIDTILRLAEDKLLDNTGFQVVKGKTKASKLKLVKQDKTVG